MIFPLDIKNNIKVNIPVGCSSDSSPYVYDVIKGVLWDMKVDILKEEMGIVTFKNRLFNKQRRSHLFAMIDSGTVIYNSEKQQIIFNFRTIRAFYIILAMSAFLGFVSMHFFVFVLAFLWIYGMNVLIFKLRLILFNKKLKKRIEDKLVALL